MANIYKTDWRKSLAEIKATDAEYNKYGKAMTPLELSKLTEKKQSLKESYRKYISDGVTQELNEKIEQIKRKRDALQVKKKAESNSWDSAKMSSEYGIMSVVLDMTLVAQNPALGDTVSKRVEKLWKEAQTSENKYKIRALSDLLDGVIVKAEMEEARKVNLVKLEAQKLVSDMRETPEIIKAKDEVQKSFEDFSQTLREYRDAGRTLGEETNFDWNIRNIRLVTDEDGLPAVEEINT